ncbi:hypothetical protein MFIFM68171_02082 [Madurella fahalii]|uniref:HNH nuclease domain-containing protein n=1 Tax=Madurella fahalii TaxID=1157608 RepID=A0ABQ0G278_9PEZI
MNPTSSTPPPNLPGNVPISIRCRYRKPSHPESVYVPSNIVKRILFRHPGYPDTNNILFPLSALDGPGGVHHETARVACALLANSRWDGFLSTTRDGPAVLAGPDDVLTESDYYFRLPDSVDERYPIVPDFASFRFPHDNLPDSWLHPNLAIPTATDQPREAGFASIVLARDVSCRLTNHSLGTESAHLVPRTEYSWFADNAMLRYAEWPDRITTDDPRNIILLRSDVHKLFDARRFVLVPKQGVWTSHVPFGKPDDELIALYHNVELQPLKQVAVEFLFARFAWAIFAQCTFILPGPVARSLLVVQAQTFAQAVREMSGDQYLAEFGPRSTSGSQSRSKSPKKRVRESNAPDDDEVEGSEEEDEEEEFRGRPYKRWCDGIRSAWALPSPA